MGFGKRAAGSVADPWLLLTAVFGGGLAWAVGMAAVPAVAIGAGMYGIGVAVGGLFGGRGDQDTQLALPTLVGGTAQAKLVADLGAYIADLRALREGPKPDAVDDPAIEALVAAENAHGTAVRVAAAIDGLDSALERTGPPAGNSEARASVQRMIDRRVALLARLQATIDEVAEVYTKLLEMSATLGSLDVDQSTDAEVEKVNASLDALRHSLAELQRQPEV